MTDRHGNPTDDLDAAVNPPCDSFDFDPVPDYEGMEYDDWHRAPKCGGAEFENGDQVGGCPGCRHCFPPDPEAIHTGFEVYDRPDFYRVGSELRMLAAMGYALDPRDFAAGREYHRRAVGFNARLLRAAERKLDRICDESETHGSMIEKCRGKYQETRCNSQTMPTTKHQTPIASFRKRN